MNISSTPFCDIIPIKRCPSGSSLSNSSLIQKSVATERESHDSHYSQHNSTKEATKLPHSTMKLSNQLYKEYPLLIYKYAQSLLILDLSHNQIEQLPECFAIQMGALQSLDLSFNYLNSLPSNFALLKIYLLNLQNNRIRSFGTNLTNLKLKNINVSQNYFTHLPQSFNNLISFIEVFNFGWFALINFDQEQRDFQNSRLKSIMSSILIQKDLCIYDMMIKINKGKLLASAIENCEAGVISLVMKNDQILLLKNLDKVGNPLFFAYKCRKQMVSHLFNYCREGDLLKILFLFFICARNDYQTLNEISQIKDYNFQFQEDLQLYSSTLGLLMRVELGDTLFHVLFRKICFSLTDQENQEEIAKFLLNRNANPNLLNSSGLTPLHIILQMPSIRALRFAAAYNKQKQVFNFEKKSRYSKQTLLHVAAFQGYLKAIHELSIVFLQQLSLQIGKLQRIGEKCKQPPSEEHLWSVFTSDQVLTLNGKVVLEEDAISAEVFYKSNTIIFRSIQCLSSSIQQTIRNRQNSFKDDNNELGHFSTLQEKPQCLMLQVSNSLAQEKNYLLNENLPLQEKLIANIFANLSFKQMSNYRFKLQLIRTTTNFSVYFTQIVKLLEEITSKRQKLKENVKYQQDLYDNQEANSNQIKYLRKKLAKNLRLDITNYSDPQDDSNLALQLMEQAILFNQSSFTKNLINFRSSCFDYEQIQMNQLKQIKWKLKKVVELKPSHKSIGSIDDSCVSELDLDDSRNFKEINRTSDFYRPAVGRKRTSHSQKSSRDYQGPRLLKSERGLYSKFSNQKTFDIIDFYHLQ